MTPASSKPTPAKILGGKLDKRPKYIGWDEIAAVLDVSVRQAQRYAERNFDPLPVRFRGRVPYLLQDAFVAWLERDDLPASAYREVMRGRRGPKSGRVQPVV